MNNKREFLHGLDWGMLMPIGFFPCGLSEIKNPVLGRCQNGLG